MDDPGTPTSGAGAQAVALISRYGFITVEGADAAEFLQSQFSADIAALEDEQTVLTGWHDRKGRVLCCLRVVRKQSAFWLVLPASLVTDTAQELRRFVFRSKVDLADASEELGAAGIIEPGGNRYEIYAHRDRLQAAVANHHDQGVRRLSDAEWDLHDIRDGLPEVYPGTRGLYTGQMLNLDLIGGISFSKGCYPGQEVIARTHHLGRVKRRMQRYVSAGPPRVPGEDLNDDTGKRAGQVVRSAAGNGGSESLVVTSAGQPPALVAGDGSTLQPAPLPYPLA